jgi:hypothetical protein
METLFEDFFKQVASDELEIYNEFSLQHELGIFLRSHFNNRKVQFERNVSYFGFDKKLFEKKEIDIAIFKEHDLFFVIELKYPKNGQVPESMFSFCKDIAFLEQLSKGGFKTAYFIAVADDPLFYSGNESGIYGYFRNQKPITGEIVKPTGTKDKIVTIYGSYTATWKPISGNAKYCLIKVAG